MLMVWTQRLLPYFPVSILTDVAWCSSLPFLRWYEMERKQDNSRKRDKENGSIMTEPYDATRREQRRGVGSVKLSEARRHKGTDRERLKQRSNIRNASPSSATPVMQLPASKDEVIES